MGEVGLACWVPSCHLPGTVGAEGSGSRGHHPRLTDDCGIGCHSGRRENGTEMEAEVVAPHSLAHVLPRPLC